MSRIWLPLVLLLFGCGCDGAAPPPSQRAATPPVTPEAESPEKDSFWEQPHNALLLKIARQAHARRFTTKDGHEDFEPAMAALGQFSLRVPMAKYSTTLYLSPDKFGTGAIYATVIEEPGSLNYQQIEELCAMLLELDAFPMKERDLASDMVRTAERVYQADVLAKPLSEDLDTKPFRVSEPKHTHYKAKRLGESDWAEWRVTFECETEDYSIQATVLEETGDTPRAVVDVLFRPLR